MKKLRIEIMRAVPFEERIWKAMVAVKQATGKSINQQMREIMAKAFPGKKGGSK